MKVGDKVRFLSEVGGGTVTGFQGKDIVLVEDEDGFDIPMLKSQVVVIGQEEYEKPQQPHPQPLSGERGVSEGRGVISGSSSAASSSGHPDSVASLPNAQTLTRVAPRRGAGGEAFEASSGPGLMLNLYLAFVPNDVKAISETTFETYLINDSDFYVQVLYLSAEGANWRARFCATVEPNTKVFVEEFDRSQLGELERVAVQAMAWKPDRVFPLKPTLTTEVRLDCTKFYKMHVFQPNEFFRDPNWTVPLVRDDKPVRSLFPDADAMRQALLGQPAHEPQPARQPKKAQEGPAHSKPNRKPEIIEVDLHIEQLIDNLSGLSAGDMLMVQMKEFRRVMDEHVKQPGTRIVFIHGKGEGVLRKNILQELRARYKNCTAQDASFHEYGFGATMVKVMGA